ncbi:class I SAM-dependent methyltransferase [Nocardia alni]|uniref:class I SAM-dependent methyltransferase n=1 Tax=Nocardia alni TaxID=2815723 RepID=UPI001C232EB6|nr:class I SAM-dependent methyltransferase [Nocardia alni]
MTADQDRATSFGSIAQDYDRLRPGPPAQAVEWLIPAGCGTALDLAAGTGLFTRALAERVPEVIAVEPDDRMRAVLAERSPGVRALAGRAEQIPLPDASVDAVFVSAAWHWFDHKVAIAEIARVLRDGGRLGVVWTSRDRTVDWVFELDAARIRASDSETDEDLRRRMEQRWHFTTPEGSPFGETEGARFPFTLTMTPDEVVAWLGTYSQVIVADPADRDARLSHIRTVLDEHANGSPTVEIPLTSQCWRINRLPR